MKTHYLTVRLCREEWQKVADLARETQRSKSSVVRLLVQQAHVLRERDVALQPVARPGAEARGT